MLVIPKTVPLNWYKYDVQFSIELLRGYLRDVEQQIIDSIAAFQKDKEVHVFENSEEGYADVIERHRELDDSTWDLKGIFESHFPNLQRRGALITLYSFLEHELDDLCELYIKNDNLKISLSDMSGKGIERAILFLQKIVGLEIDKTAKVWGEIKNIQKVRNLIVHNDAKLKSRAGNGQADVIKYVQNSSYLSGEDEIIILDGYLFYVLKTFDCHFQEIDKLVSAKART